jgi:TolB protein
LLAWDYRAAGAKTSEIWVMDAEGKNKRAVTKRNSGSFADLSWSPDGSRLAFVYTDNLTGVEGLCTINADGTGFETFATTASESFYNLRWSPDGKKVLYTIGMLGTKPYSAIQVLDLGSKSNKMIVASEKRWINDNADWSPDGNQIVFTSNRSGARTLWKAPSGGGTPVQLSNSEFDDAPVWLPGGQIAYLTTKSGQRQIIVLNPSTARTASLTMPGRIIGGPKVSPDGRYLAFARVERVPELWVANLTD